ncbi:MAG: hypothetical protein A4E72_00433 [Syntrophus sp. PtaU1.Bin208]|nr:MAG: hypothetical protein A4E72_00433 [Syntrophus sp. PtaU1.Bin208]
MEERRIPPADKPLIEENVGYRQNHGTEHIMLDLFIGLVAHPHRPHSAIACERLNLSLLQILLPIDAINGLDTPTGGSGNNVDQISEIALHRTGRAETIQGADHEIRITEPAVPVIPVPPGVRGFGNGRGHGRNDGPGIIKGVEFQGNGGTNDFLLPLKGNAQIMHPVMPVTNGFYEKSSRQFRNGF